MLRVRMAFGGFPRAAAYSTLCSQFSTEELREQMDKKFNIRNMSVIAHVDHGAQPPASACLCCTGLHDSSSGHRQGANASRKRSSGFGGTWTVINLLNPYSRRDLRIDLRLRNESRWVTGLHLIDPIAACSFGVRFLFRESFLSNFSHCSPCREVHPYRLPGGRRGDYLRGVCRRHASDRHPR